MGQVIEFVPQLNQEVTTAKPPIAKEIVQIAAAHGIQTAAEMNANFTAISTAALTVLTKKLAEATAQLNVPLATLCSKSIEDVMKHMVTNGTNTTDFIGNMNKFAE